MWEVDLFKTFASFLEKDSGMIAYNGMDVDDITTSNLLDNVTMVSQSTYLLMKVLRTI